MTNWQKKLKSLAGTCVILQACVSSDMRLNRPFEQAPPEWADRPYLYGQPHYKEFDDLQALRAYCKSWGVSIDNPIACYLPQFNIVVTPSRKAWPSEREIQWLREHEEAHAKGWSHDEPGIVDWRARMGLK